MTVTFDNSDVPPREYGEIQLFLETGTEPEVSDIAVSPSCRANVTKDWHGLSNDQHLTVELYNAQGQKYGTAHVDRQGRVTIFPT